MGAEDSKDIDESKRVWLSSFVGGLRHYNKQRDEDSDPSYIIGIPAPEKQLADLQYQLPLKIKVFRDSYEEVPVNQKTITVNEKSHKC